MNKYIRHNHSLYLAGGFEDSVRDTCWYVHGNEKPQQDLTYTRQCRRDRHALMDTCEAN